MTNQSELFILNFEEWKSAVIASIFQTLRKKNSYDDSTGYHIILSGGNTPIPIYELFKNLDLPWQKIHFWMADERCVSKTHLDSNEKAIKEALGMDILENATFHPIAEGNPKESAALYSNLLKSIAFFDIGILGIGEDGHTASLFPSNDLGITIDSPDAIPVFNSPKPPKERVSLSLNCINRCKNILFLVAGECKRNIADAILKKDPKYPASLVHGLESREIYYSL